MHDYLPRLFHSLRADWASGFRYIMLAHLFDDTMRMIDAMAPQVTFEAVVGVPYSSNRSGLRARWQGKYGDLVRVPSTMEDLETQLIAALDHCLALCEQSDQQLIVQEVGGFVVPLLHSHFADRLHLVRGVVEITKQGVWRSAEVDPKIPVLHCADSELKRLEAKRCGETIVRCLDGLFRAQGMTLAGRSATVFGAGWIGRGVADALRSLDAIPALVDPDPLKVVEARLDGFRAGTQDRWSSRSHLCVGASGRTSITAQTLQALPNNAFVASGSSRQMEIDVEYLHALPHEAVGDAVTAYHLSAPDRRIYLVNDGFPANFIPGSASVPDEIVEPILGELMVLMQALTQQSFTPGLHRMSPQQEQICARLWLDMRDEDFNTESPL